MDDAMVGSVRFETGSPFKRPIRISDLDPATRELIEMGRKAKATISSIYSTCEGARGYYKDALDLIMSEAADFLWPEEASS